MARVEIISGPKRWRRSTDEEKQAIVAESFAQGAVVSAVPRRVEVCPGQIYQSFKDRARFDAKARSYHSRMESYLPFFCR